MTGLAAAVCFVFASCNAQQANSGNDSMAAASNYLRVADGTPRVERPARRKYRYRYRSRGHKARAAVPAIVRVPAECPLPVPFELPTLRPAAHSISPNEVVRNSFEALYTPWWKQ
jgi:hypothetical protein